MTSNRLELADVDYIRAYAKSRCYKAAVQLLGKSSQIVSARLKMIKLSRKLTDESFNRMLDCYATNDNDSFKTVTHKGREYAVLNKLDSFGNITVSPIHEGKKLKRTMMMLGGGEYIVNK